MRAQVAAVEEAAAVVEGDGGVEVCKVHAEQTGVARRKVVGRGPLEGGVVCIRAAVAGVIDARDDVGGARQRLGQRRRVAVQDGAAGQVVGAVGHEGRGVGGEELVAVLRGKGAGQGAVVPRHGRVQDHGAAHHVGVAAEGLGQGGDDDVGHGEDVDVGKGADCVVYHEGEVVLVGLFVPYILLASCFFFFFRCVLVKNRCGRVVLIRDSGVTG